MCACRLAAVWALLLQDLPCSTTAADISYPTAHKNSVVQPDLTKKKQPGHNTRPENPIMCLWAGTGQSPIYNEPWTAWSRAHARSELDCCSPRQGGPLPSTATAQGLTTTTATGTDIRSAASVITTQTLLNTVSTDAGTAHRPALPYFLLCFGVVGCFFFWTGGAGFLFREDISRALSVLRYSGRPVEGAASRAATSVAAFLTHKRGHIYCSRLGALRPFVLATWRSFGQCCSLCRSFCFKGPAVCVFLYCRRIGLGASLSIQ